MSCEHKHVTDSEARCTDCGITAEGVVFSLHGRIRALNERLDELETQCRAVRGAYADGGNAITSVLRKAIDALGSMP